jgi:hypothetical protein
MLHVDIPPLSEIKRLAGIRTDACVSIYLPTTPETANIGATRIAFGNLARRTREKLEASGLDKRRRGEIEDALVSIAEDDEFWEMQANSLAVLASPEMLRTYRMATAVSETVVVADRFLFKPLLRAIAFPQTALVLALSENDVRLIEIFPDRPPSEIRVPGMPKDAAAAAGRASVNNLTQNTRIANAEGQTVLLRQYARKVDAALGTVLAGRETPLILAATQPLDGIFRSTSNAAGLLPQGIAVSPDRMSEAELAAAARPVLDAHYRAEVEAANALFAARENDRRATTNLGEAARAATGGAIELLMVDIDGVTPGTVSEAGAVDLAGQNGPGTYDIVDEIAGRALRTGAKLLAVRAADLPGDAPLAAVLRYPI